MKNLKKKNTKARSEYPSNDIPNSRNSSQRCDILVWSSILRKINLVINWTNSDSFGLKYLKSNQFYKEFPELGILSDGYLDAAQSEWRKKSNQYHLI